MLFPCFAAIICNNALALLGGSCLKNKAGGLAFCLIY